MAKKAQLESSPPPPPQVRQKRNIKTSSRDISKFCFNNPLDRENLEDTNEILVAYPGVADLIRTTHRLPVPGLRDDFSYQRWIDYLLDVPMMFVQVNKKWQPAQGMSFRTFMESGFQGYFPSWDDWELHMTSVFPEVRIKRTIEVRGADCVPHETSRRP